MVIVGSDGNIRWIDVHPGYAPRTEAAQILAVLGELDSQPLRSTSRPQPGRA